MTDRAAKGLIHTRTISLLALFVPAHALTRLIKSMGLSVWLFTIVVLIGCVQLWLAYDIFRLRRAAGLTWRGTPKK